MDRDRKMIKLQKTILNCPVSLISHLKAICLRLLWYTDCPIQLNWNTLGIQQMTFKTFTHELCYYWQSLLESNRYLIKQQDAANLRPPSTQSSIPELRSVKAGTNSVLNMLGYSSCFQSFVLFSKLNKKSPTIYHQVFMWGNVWCQNPDFSVLLDYLESSGCVHNTWGRASVRGRLNLGRNLNSDQVLIPNYKMKIPCLFSTSS